MTISVGKSVKVNQGFNKFTLGEVVSYTPDANRLGNKGNYLIKITGGVDCFGKPAKIGALKNVQESNVELAK